MPDYFASTRGAYKSLACRKLRCFWSDTGPAGRILGNIGALQKYQFHDGYEGKKLKLFSSYYRPNRSSFGQISELLRLRKESYMAVLNWCLFVVGLPSFSETYLPLNCYVSTFDFANRERFEGPTKRLVFYIRVICLISPVLLQLHGLKILRLCSWNILDQGSLDTIE